MPPTETVTTTNSSAISGSFEARTDSGTDRFHFICDIASGGIGRVELAAKVGGRFRRLFAIKRLQDAYRNDPEFLEMFMEEARIAGLVRHPNVVAVLDVGVDARGPFLAMDYVEGVSAEHVVREHRKRGVPTPLQLALAIAIEAAEGLHAAHVTKDAQGRALHLIHRDVSPQNILVGYDGVSRVTDFGIAKAIGRATNTDAGVLKGKLGYMSPEQLRFEELDQRSDIFALGVVLYELLTCTRLYRSQQGMEGPQRILREPPPDVGEARAGLAPELVELVFAMLAKEREARPATCLEVARRLEQVRAEVVEREGRLELAEYVQEFFREQRANHDARIADAVERTDFGRTPRSAATQTRAEGSVAPAPPVTSDPIPTPPARARRSMGPGRRGGDRRDGCGRLLVCLRPGCGPTRSGAGVGAEPERRARARRFAPHHRAARYSTRDRSERGEAGDGGEPTAAGARAVAEAHAHASAAGRGSAGRSSHLELERRVSSLEARRARFEEAVRRAAGAARMPRASGTIVDERTAWDWASAGEAPDGEEPLELTQRPWPAEWSEPIARGAMLRARVALLALDLHALEGWLAVLARAAAREAALAHLASWGQALCALATDRAELDDIARHERGAARVGDALATVDLAAFGALTALQNGKLSQSIAVARRASRMARAEHLGAAEEIAHLVLARARRMTGHPQLAARICRSLAGHVCSAWAAWELAMAGSASDGPLGRFLDAVERAPNGEVSLWKRELVQWRRPVWIVEDRDAAFAGLDLDAPAPPAVAGWLEGQDDTLPPVLGGIALRRSILASDDEDSNVYVAVTSSTARRVLRAGLQRASVQFPVRLTQGHRKQGRTESLVAALALAGSRGLHDADLFARVYGFAFDPRIHRGAFDVAFHRVRKYVEPVGTLVRQEGRSTLEAQRRSSCPTRGTSPPTNERSCSSRRWARRLRLTLPPASTSPCAWRSAFSPSLPRRAAAWRRRMGGRSAMSSRTRRSRSPPTHPPRTASPRRRRTIRKEGLC